MASLTRAQIETLAKNAGFKGMDLGTAVGIAYAESGGNPTAYNGKDKDSSYGLWQINMKGALGPDRRKRFNLASNDDLFKPEVNARVAYAIYKAQGFQPWTTYTRGEYLKYMDGMTTEEGGNKSISERVDDVKETLNPLSGVPEAVNAFGSTLFKASSSIAGIIVAVVLLILGIVILLRSQVMNVVPLGKVGKIAKGLAK